MTPSLFFRLVSWFAAFMGVLHTVFAVLVFAQGEAPVGGILLILAAINLVGWRMFAKWSRMMRG